MLHRKIVVDKGRCEIVCFSQIRAFPALFGIKSAHPCLDSSATTAK